MDTKESFAYRIIRFSERYLKTDMVYALKGGSWLLFGYGFQLITGTIIAVLFANFLTKESYGFYQFIISMSAVASVFTLTGIGTAIARAAARGDDGSLRFGARVEFRWSMGIAAAGFALALYYFLRGNEALGIAFIVVGLSQPIITTFNLYKSYLHGKQFFKKSSLVENTQRFLPFATLLVLIFFTQNPLLLVSAYFITNAIASFVAYKYVVISERLPKSSNPELVNYGKHLSVMESFSEIAMVADKILVWTFLGAASTAAYALAQLPIIHMQTMFGFLRQLAFPKLARKDISEVRKILPEKIKTYSIAAIIVVGVYVVAAPLFFKTLFPNYPEAVLYSQILALTILAVPRSLITQTFAAQKMKKELYTINITTPIVRIVGLAIGLPLFGIWGAIGAILLSEWYSAVLQFFLFRRIRITK